MDTLGVKIACDGTLHSDNIEEIFTKVRGTLNQWGNRQASLMGKVLIINTLVGSLFVHKMLAMTKMSECQVRELESLIKSFIWPKSKPRIDIRMLQKKKSQGGLKLIDIRAKQRTLHVSHMFKLENDTFLANCAYENLDRHLRQSIWKCNLNKKDASKMFSASTWRDILESWASINFRQVESKAEVLNQIIWYNSHVRLDSKPLMWKKWYEKGFLLIEDLFDQEGNPLSQATALDRLGQEKWLNYHALIRAIPGNWRNMLKSNVSGENTKSLYATLEGKVGVSQAVYDLMIEDKEYLRKYANRWSDHLESVDYEIYQKSFDNLSYCTKVPKYRDFQYRMLLLKIVTNQDLYKWGKITSDNCSLCGEQSESMKHLFECRKITGFIELLNDMCTKNDTEPVSFNSFILNIVHNQAANIINYVCIMVKQYIYSCRCLGKIPTVFGCKLRITDAYNIELFNAKKGSSVGKFMKRWSPIYPILSEW